MAADLMIIRPPDLNVVWHFEKKFAIKISLGI